MVTLPRSLPPEMKSLLERALSGSDFRSVICEVASVVRRLCNARDLLLMLTVKGAPQSIPAELELASSGSDGVFREFLADLPARWKLAGLHDYVSADLEVSLSAISYSAFSWPYPTLPLYDETDGRGFVVPREYTVFIPCSSDLTVANDNQPAFFGYVALMFDAFPTMTDSLVHLIVTLPGLLSEIIASVISEHSSRVVDLYRSHVHDARRQLMLLKEHLDRLQRGAALNGAAETLGHMDRIVSRTLQRMQSLTIAGRAWSDVPKIAPVRIDLNELVQETVGEFQPRFQSAGKTVICELAADLPPVPLDPSVFTAVVENLLDNAAKYSPRPSRIEVRTAAAPGVVRLQIANDGVPIPLEERELVFAPRFRLNGSSETRGEGLGLFVVRRVVEAHGGRAFVAEAGPDRSVFVVELPVTSFVADDDRGH